MKLEKLIVISLCVLAVPAAAMDQQAPVAEPAPAAIASEAVPAEAGSAAMQHESGMMPKGQCRHKKGQGGMKQGAGRHRKCQHEGHEQVVQRLDMIDARLAKIEAMLESLMRR